MRKKNKRSEQFAIFFFLFFVRDNYARLNRNGKGKYPLKIDDAISLYDIRGRVVECVKSPHESQPKTLSMVCGANPTTLHCISLLCMLVS